MKIFIYYIFIYIKFIISYIVEKMYFCSNINQQDDIENGYLFNILCTTCNRNIKITEKVYCIYDKTFCTINCRNIYLKN